MLLAAYRTFVAPLLLQALLYDNHTTSDVLSAVRAHVNLGETQLLKNKEADERGLIESLPRLHRFQVNASCFDWMAQKLSTGAANGSSWIPTQESIAHYHNWTVGVGVRLSTAFGGVVWAAGNVTRRSLGCWNQSIPGGCICQSFAFSATLHHDNHPYDELPGSSCVCRTLTAAQAGIEALADPVVSEDMVGGAKPWTKPVPRLRKGVVLVSLADGVYTSTGGSGDTACAVSIAVPRGWDVHIALGRT